MKKIILINFIFLFLSAPLVYAQKEKIINLPNFDKRKIHFGYYLGVNNNSFNIKYWDQGGVDRPIDPGSPINPIPEGGHMFVDVNSKLGFNIGFVIDYKLHKNINLRFEPGLRSNTKELTFINVNFYDGYSGTTDNVREVSGTYLHMPLLVKFSTNRLNNIRPYVIGGIAYDYNFSSNEKNPDDNYDIEFRMTANNFMYEVGLGIDLYFDFFKFTPSIRGIFAMNNELILDDIHDYSDTGRPYSSPWTGPIEFLGTSGVFLNLTFE